MKNNPTVKNAIHRVRRAPDACRAVVFAAAFARTLGFSLGYVLGERGGAGSEGRQAADES